MSDPAGIFRKFRDADDVAGNLGWSSQMARKGIKAASAAPPDLEDAFGLSDDERVLWRLLQIPRRYLDLENAGVLPADRVRGLLRGLVSADVVDVIEGQDAKPIVPIEITRLRKSLAGQSNAKSAGGATLKARVYRPDISTGATAEAAASGPPQTASPSPPPSPPPKEPSRSPPAAPAARPAAAESTKSAVAPSAVEAKLIEEINRRHAQMAKQNHYQFLDVQPSAQPDGIRRAYMAMAKELHPDRIASAVHEEEATKKADSLFKRLQDAWSTLNDPDRRKQYDARLGEDPTAGGTGSRGKIRRTDEAKVATLKADHLVKTKQLKEAEAQYKAALLLDEDYLQAQIGLAWAIFLNEARPKDERVPDAKKRLLVVASKHKAADAHYKLALIARLEGDEEELERRIGLAVKTDPQHKDAKQELRVLQRRKGSQVQGTGAKGSGLFSKLKR